MVQRELFDVFPEKPSMVEFAKAYYVHKAKAISADEQLCVAIVSALEYGHSIRSVARVFKIGRNTVCGVVEVMRANGKLEPLKAAIANKFLRVSQEALDAFMDRLEKHPGEFSPQELSWAAVNFAKTGGEVMGSSPDISRPKGEQSLADKVAAAFDACVRLANSIPVESAVNRGSDTESVGSTAEVVEITALSTPCNTPATLHQADAPTTTSDQSADVALEAEPSKAGGGGRDPRAVPNSQWESSVGKF